MQRQRSKSLRMGSPLRQRTQPSRHSPMSLRPTLPAAVLTLLARVLPHQALAVVRWTLKALKIQILWRAPVTPLLVRQVVGPSIPLFLPHPVPPPILLRKHPLKQLRWAEQQRRCVVRRRRSQLVLAQALASAAVPQLASVQLGRCPKPWPMPCHGCHPWEQAVRQLASELAHVWAQALVQLLVSMALLVVPVPLCRPLQARLPALLGRAAAATAVPFVSTSSLRMARCCMCPGRRAVLHHPSPNPQIGKVAVSVAPAVRRAKCSSGSPVQALAGCCDGRSHRSTLSRRK